MRALVVMTASVLVLGPAAARASTPPTAPPPTTEDGGAIGGIGIRLLDAPVSGRDDPRARVYIVDHLAPGSVIERRVEVVNSSTSSQRVVLYPAAASIVDGSFVGAAEDTQNDLSTWTSVTPADADVAPAETMTAMVKISVPADAAPGEQYGVMWAETRSDAGSGGGVVQVSRVGIRLYVSVGAGNAPASDFAIDTITAGRSADGRPTVSAMVHNTGGRALDMHGTLHVSEGPGGLSAGPFAADLGNTLAIGGSQAVTVHLDDQLPAGPWSATIMLESGTTERTATATITFPASGSAEPVAAVPSGDERSWLLPAIAAVLCLFLVAIVLGLMLRRRRTQRARTGTPLRRDPVLLTRPPEGAPTPLLPAGTSVSDRA